MATPGKPARKATTYHVFQEVGTVLVAVPSRSWKPRTVKVEQQTKVTFA